MIKIIKIKWYKLISLMIFLPLMGCVDETESEEINSQIKTALDIETELDIENLVERIDKISLTDKLALIDKTVNDIDLLPKYVTIEIQWDDLASNEDGFLIERGTSIEGEFILLTSLEMNKTSYLDSMALKDNNYCYRIGAYNEVGVAYSDVSCSNE